MPKVHFVHGEASFLLLLILKPKVYLGFYANTTVCVQCVICVCEVNFITSKLCFNHAYSAHFFSITKVLSRLVGSQDGNTGTACCCFIIEKETEDTAHQQQTTGGATTTGG